MTDLGARTLFAAAKAAYDRQDFRAAEDLCRRILQDKRKDLNAVMLLAEIARCTERRSEELEHVKRAAKLYPRNAEVRYQLGKAYASRGEYAKALAQYERAEKLDPQLLLPLIGKATVFEFRNKYDRARALLEPLVRRATPPPMVAMVYLRILLHDGEHERAIEIGRAVVDAGHAPSDELRETWFLLAKAYERGGEPDHAFAAAREANALQGDHFDPDGYREQVDTYIETFSAERLASLPRAEPSTLPIFVVGVPRCGSTLTERIIDAHAEAHGAGESRAMMGIIREMPLRIESPSAYPACAVDLTAEQVQSMSRSYLEEIEALAPRARRITDKALGNFQHLGLINLLFPAGRVIHCRRDPLDTCLSCYFEPFMRGQCPPACNLRHLGLFYRQYERLMRHWQGVLDIRILEVDYEALVQDQEGMSRRIIEFCGLEWDDACLRSHETARRDRTLSYDQVRRPVYRSSVGRAERFGALLDPLRAALAEGR